MPRTVSLFVVDNHELVACAYIYLFHQLKYHGTDDESIVVLFGGTHAYLLNS